MELKSYKCAREVPDKYLWSFVDSQIECWWSSPFNQFKICTNLHCLRSYSIDEVCGNIYSYRSWYIWKEFICPNCNSDTSYIYEKWIHLKIIRNYINSYISITLVILNNNKVEWFWVISKISLHEIIQKDLWIMKWGYDPDYLLQLLSEESGKLHSSMSTNFVYFHHIYISPFLKKWNMSFDVLKKLFLLNEEYKGLPVILEMKDQTDIYELFLKIWFKNLLDDKQGNNILYLEDYSTVIQYFS